MKKTNLILMAIASATLLGACSGGTNNTSDKEVVDAIAAKSALIVSSGTNKGLNNGKDESNTLKSPAYLYAAIKFSYPDAYENGEKTTVVATVAWALSDETNVVKSPFDATHEKYVFTYSAITAKITYVFTGTITYKTATATAVFNVTINAA